MNEATEHQLMIASPHARRFLFGGETVHFYILQALRPLWVQTPSAIYPLLRDEELSITLPDSCGTYRIGFFCGDEEIHYTFTIG